MVQLNFYSKTIFLFTPTIYSIHSQSSQSVRFGISILEYNHIGKCYEHEHFVLWTMQLKNFCVIFIFHLISLFFRNMVTNLRKPFSNSNNCYCSHLAHSWKLCTLVGEEKSHKQRLRIHVPIVLCYFEMIMKNLIDTAQSNITV